MAAVDPVHAFAEQQQGSAFLPGAFLALPQTLKISIQAAPSEPSQLLSQTLDISCTMLLALLSRQERCSSGHELVSHPVHKHVLDQ